MRGHHGGRVRAGISGSTSPGLFSLTGSRAGGRSHGHRREGDFPFAAGTLPRNERARLDPDRVKKSPSGRLGGTKQSPSPEFSEPQGGWRTAGGPLNK